MGTCQERPALMFVAGPETDYTYITAYLQMHPNAVIACADGGLRHAKAMGLTPDILVGDFDSSNLSVQERANAICLRPEKDDTDAQHCMKVLMEYGYKDITVVCASGGRIDHMLANLSLPEQAWQQGAQCSILDKQNLVVFHAGGTQHIKKISQYPYFSIIPLDACLHGVTIAHAKYNLQHASIYRAGMVSISNEPIADSFTVTIEQGRALIVLSRDA